MEKKKNDFKPKKFWFLSPSLFSYHAGKKNTKKKMDFFRKCLGFPTTEERKLQRLNQCIAKLEATITRLDADLCTRACDFPILCTASVNRVNMLTPSPHDSKQNQTVYQEVQHLVDQTDSAEILQVSQHYAIDGDLILHNKQRLKLLTTLKNMMVTRTDLGEFHEHVENFQEEAHELDALMSRVNDVLKDSKSVTAFQDDLISALKHTTTTAQTPTPTPIPITTTHTRAMKHEGRTYTQVPTSLVS